MSVLLTDDLRKEYASLFSACSVKPEHTVEVNKTVANIVANRSRYETVSSQLGVPWYVVGAIHCLEASLSFQTHLHNGDPLTARTVHVPANRPTSHDPPFTWEESATDALRLRGLDKVKDWSLPGALFQLEGYNGFGYRRLTPVIATPYLWSFSQNYTSGKFVEDGKFDPSVVSKQCGAAVIIHTMTLNGTLRFDDDGNPLPDPQTATTS